MSQLEQKKVVSDFIMYFKSLTEAEQFKIGAVFKQQTGGKLSPYNSPSPVAVGLIQVQDGEEVKLLGVIRNVLPKIGEIALPGGFVNELEEAEIAVAREIFEETGLDTYPEDYEFIKSVMAPSNSLLMFYMNKNIYPKSILDDLLLNSEVSGFVLIERDTPIAFPLHKKIIDKFFSPQSFNRENKMRMKK